MQHIYLYVSNFTKNPDRNLQNHFRSVWGVDANKIEMVQNSKKIAGHKRIVVLDPVQQCVRDPLFLSCHKININPLYNY